jgi:lysozyme family protein
MASNNFERCLAITLKWEGGYSNHPDDPGGPTMRGIIQREYDAWRKKHDMRLRPVRQIDEDEVQAIYRNEYWDAMGCDELPAGFDLWSLTPPSTRALAGQRSGSKQTSAMTSMRIATSV